MPRLAAGSSGAASTSSLLAHIQGRNAVSRASTGSFGGRGVSTVAVLHGVRRSDQARAQVKPSIPHAVMLRSDHTSKRRGVRVMTSVSTMSAPVLPR